MGLRTAGDCDGGKNGGATFKARMEEGSGGTYGPVGIKTERKLICNDNDMWSSTVI